MEILFYAQTNCNQPTFLASPSKGTIAIACVIWCLANLSVQSQWCVNLRMRDQHSLVPRLSSTGEGGA